MRKSTNIQWITKGFVLSKLGLTAETIDIINTITTELNISKNILLQADLTDDNLLVQLLEQLFAYLLFWLQYPHTTNIIRLFALRIESRLTKEELTKQYREWQAHLAFLFHDFLPFRFNDAGFTCANFNKSVYVERFSFNHVLHLLKRDLENPDDWLPFVSNRLPGEFTKKYISSESPKP